jgi:hypothetical protein
MASINDVIMECVISLIDGFIRVMYEDEVYEEDYLKLADNTDLIEMVAGLLKIIESNKKKLCPVGIIPPACLNYIDKIDWAAEARRFIEEYIRENYIDEEETPYICGFGSKSWGFNLKTGAIEKYGVFK